MLFKLIGRRPEQPIPYEERRPALQQKLAFERQRARETQALRDAQQGVAVTLNRELAATLKPVKTNTIVPPAPMPRP